MAIETETDPAASTSLVEQMLVRLRERGSNNSKKLEGRHEYTIGAASTCWWSLVDPKRHLSRLHAELAFDGVRWVLTDKSKNGIYVGDLRHDQLVVQPGLVFRIGSLEIVAESEREVELRSILLRMLGYTQLHAVDSALQALRAALVDRKAITLCGPGDLVPIAYALHRRMLGKDRPFVVSKKGREDAEETVRAATNYQLGMDAFRAAAANSGSLCIVDGKLPPDLNALLAAIDEPTAPHVHLFVCQKKRKKPAEDPIVIPAPATRKAELDLVAQEYGAEAMAAFGIDGAMAVEDKAWVVRNCAESVAELEKGALRIVALRKHRSKNGAALALGMSRAALTKWLWKRSPLPFSIQA